MALALHILSLKANIYLSARAGHRQASSTDAGKQRTRHLTLPLTRPWVPQRAAGGACRVGVIALVARLQLFARAHHSRLISAGTRGLYQTGVNTLPVRTLSVRDSPSLARGVLP